LQPVVDAGCQRIILHARKAWLSGLSPKQNREIPPLNYERVYQAKRDYPDIQIHLNGGVDTIAAAQEHLQHVDGVMIGRAAYSNPWILADVDRLFDSAAIAPSKEAVIETMVMYIEDHIRDGGRFWHVARHMIGLYQNCPGARQWRRMLSEQGPRAVDISPLLQAQQVIQDEARRFAEHQALSDAEKNEVKA